jgi:DNA uptake protein ComE-like DNA-binding protein
VADRKAAVAQRRSQALRLRREGRTYEAIAAEMGCSTSQAHRYVTEAVAEVYRDDAKALAMLQLERNRAAIAALWPKIEAGDTKAVAALVRLQDHEAKLVGLYAPQKQQIDVALEGVDFEQATAELLNEIGGTG